MKYEQFLKQLKNPETYDKKSLSIKHIQTHISHVILTGEYAYKIKKPVDFGFLDFTTIDKRKKFCEEEIKLNKRLCPEIYLELVKITQDNDKIKINGTGKIIEYAVKMMQFSQKNIMTKLLEDNKITEEDIEKIVKRLVKFYKKSKNTKEIDIYGTIDIIKQNTDENFEQTKKYINQTITRENYDFIKKSTNDFLKNKKETFNKRVKEGYILDCHGDLHSGNIVIMNKKVCIFDCIEFNKRFRYSDVASDIAFLAMDLDYQGKPYLSSNLISNYIKESKDDDILKILNFYKCYRAYVRGKVISFRLDDSNITKEEKKQIKQTAKKYFELSNYYAKLFSEDTKTKNKNLLFITSGLTGTGKTTTAKKISIDYRANLISTDEVRKELEGIDKYERHHDAYNTGLYSPEKMIKTYEKIIEKANILLKEGENVILDATFKTNKLREMAERIASENKSRLIILHTICPEKIVKNHLQKRVQKKSISDGRWEIYLKQKDTFEQLKKEDNVIDIDVSKKSFVYQIKVFNKIINKAYLR